MFIQGKEFSDGIICVVVDYSRSEHAGAGGCFQVCDICIEDTNGNEKSILKAVLIDQGKHYLKLEEVIKDLGLNPKFVDYKEEIL